MNFGNIYIILLISLSTGNSVREFNFPLSWIEYLKSASIIKQLEIRNCIFVSNHGNIFENVKNFSKENLMASMVNHEGLIKYIQIGIFPNINTAIILKESNPINIAKMFEYLEKLNITYRVQKFTWLVFFKYYNSTDVEKFNVPYNCRFIIAYPTTENDHKLMEVYKVKNKTFSTEFEIFDNKNLVMPNNFLYLKRMDLNGTELTMMVPANDLTEKSVLASRQRKLFADIAKMMNFHYGRKIVDVYDSVTVNLIGDFLHSAYPFHVDFFKPDMLGPIFKAVINWYIKYPIIENRGSYIQPFHANLWLFIFSIILIVTVALILIKNKLNEKVSSVEIAFIGFDVICNQDGYGDYRRISFKIVCFSLRIMAMFIIFTYNAIIISYLAIKIAQIPFRNLEGFSNDGRYLMALGNLSFMHVYFRESNDPILNHIYKNLSFICDHPLPEDVIERMCDENLALAFVDNNIYSLDIKCDILQIERPITFTPSGIMLATNSEFKEVFNYNLITFYTSGIQQRFRMESEKHTRIKPREDALAPVEVKQIVQLLIIIQFGFVLSGIIFIFEIYYNRSRGIKK